MDNIRDILGPAHRPLSEVQKIEAIPTGILSLDEITGIGGIPRGRIIEVQGENHSGKTTLVLNIAKHILDNGGNVAWFSIGEGFDINYATMIGIIGKDNFTIPPVESADDLFFKIKLLLAYDWADLIVIDSLQAITAELVQEREQEQLKMNENVALAKVVSAFCKDISGGYMAREIQYDNIEESSEKGKKGKYIKSNTTIYSIVSGKCVPITTKHFLEHKKACIIGISRLSHKIGVTFGDDTETGGGRGKNYDFSMRLRTTGGTKVMKKQLGKDILKYRIGGVYVKKNKVGIPFGKCEFVMWPNGIITPVDAKLPQESESEKIKSIATDKPKKTKKRRKLGD